MAIKKVKVTEYPDVENLRGYYAIGFHEDDEGKLEVAKCDYGKVEDAVDTVTQGAEDAGKYAEEAKASAEAAKESEDNAKESEDNAKASEEAAKESEDNAKASEDVTVKIGAEVLDRTKHLAGVYYGTTEPTSKYIKPVWVNPEGHVDTLAKVAFSGSFNDLKDVPGGMKSPDTELSDTSTNAVQNKVIKAGIDLKQDALTQGNGVTIASNTVSAKAGDKSVLVDTDGIKVNKGDTLTISEDKLEVNYADGLDQDATSKKLKVALGDGLEYNTTTKKIDTVVTKVVTSLPATGDDSTVYVLKTVGPADADKITYDTYVWDGTQYVAVASDAFIDVDELPATGEEHKVYKLKVANPDDATDITYQYWTCDENGWQRFYTKDDIDSTFLTIEDYKKEKQAAVLKKLHNGQKITYDEAQQLVEDPTHLYVYKKDDSPLYYEGKAYNKKGTKSTTKTEVVDMGVVTSLANYFAANDVVDEVYILNIPELVTDMTDVWSSSTTVKSTPVTHLDFSRIKRLGGIWGSTHPDNLDITGIDTSACEEWAYAFAGISELPAGFDTLDTSSAKNMANMFYGCSQLTTLDVASWNTSSLSNASNMFYGCSQLTTLDVASWNTSSLSNAVGMFYGCSQLTTLDVSSWNTSSLSNAGNMFQNCRNISSLDISAWDITAIRNIGSMFNNCNASIAFGTKDFGNITNVGQFMNNSATTVTGTLSNWKNNVGYWDMRAPLDHDSAMVFINGLYDYAADGDTSTHTFTFHANTKALLTTADIQIATDKGWTIA